MIKLPDIIKNLLSDAKMLAVATHSESITVSIFTLCVLRLLKKDTSMYALKSNIENASVELSQQCNSLFSSKVSNKASIDLQRLTVSIISKHYSPTLLDVVKCILELDNDGTSEIIKKYGISPDILSSISTNNSADTLEILPPELDPFCVDLSLEAKNNQLEPLIGRQNELNSLVEVLSKRKKNSPLLVGEAGVGKSALVEGLAQMIHDKTVHSALIGARIVSVDLSAMIAGTKYRGEFEDRINVLLRYISSNQSVILFIDEIHNIVGAGSAEGSMDAANILKPYLARGKIKCIGATTHTEFDRYISHDKALSRRFSNIEIKEPSTEDTVHILSKIKGRYEKHHNVSYDNDLITEIPQIVKLNTPHKSLPDSAIDMMDILGAKISILGRKDRKITIKDVELLGYAAETA
jgi:ATP-dependent Clp protease ATP-binding subunit ClpA